VKKLFETKNISKVRIENILTLESKKHSTKEKIQLTKDPRSEKSRSEDISFMREFFEKEIKSVLCIGCRDDSELQSFISSGIDAKGVDINDNPSPRIIRLDAAKISNTFKENEFDIIYSRHSLEHIIDPDSFLESAGSIAKLGIYIVLPPGKEPRQGHPTHFNIMKEVTEKDVESEDVSHVQDIVNLINRDVKSVKIKTKPQEINKSKKEVLIGIKF